MSGIVTWSLSHLPSLALPKQARGLAAAARSTKLLVISGVGEVARAIRLEAAKRPDSKVCLLSRTKVGNLGPNEMSFQATDQQTADPAYLDILISGIVKGKRFERIHFVNTKGSAHGNSEKAIRDLNEKPASAAAEALSRIARRTRKKTVLSHLSSRCAVDGTCSYSRLRAEVDERLHKLDLCTVVLRPDLVLSPLGENKITENHPYGPSSIAALPIHPSFRQHLQPLAAEDLAAAIVNAGENEESAIINAVGPEAIRWDALVKFFTDLAGKPHVPVRVPIEIAEWLAKYAPLGRVAPYAVEILKKTETSQSWEPLSHKPFEKLVGRPLKTVSDVYRPSSDGPLILARPPVLKHCKMVARQLWKNGIARREFTALVKKYGPALVRDCIRAAQGATVASR